MPFRLSRRLLLTLPLLVAAGVALGACARSDAGRAEDGMAGLPSEIAVNGGRGTQYVQAAAVAAIVEKHTPMKGFAETSRSHVAAMPLFQERKLDFIFVSQSETYLANRGAEYYEAVGPTPIRVVAAGSEIMFSFFTRPDSGITSLEELAGRKVMWDTKTVGGFYWAAKYVLDYRRHIDRKVSP